MPYNVLWKHWLMRAIEAWYKANDATLVHRTGGLNGTERAFYEKNFRPIRSLTTSQQDLVRRGQSPKLASSASDIVKKTAAKIGDKT